MDSTDSTAWGDRTGDGVLRKLIAERSRLRAGAPPMPEPAGTISLERAVSTALARAAERAHRLPVFVEKLALSQVSLPELPELLPERALLAVIEGPRDQLGVIAICPGLLTSLIEMQALGRVTSRPAAPRRATRTDAAISEDFVNGLLTELHLAARGQQEMPGFAGFRYVTYLDDPRPLGLMLEDGQMSFMSLDLRIGTSGQRQGRIQVAMPVPAAPAISATRAPLLNAPDAPAAPEAPRLDAEISLALSVQRAPVHLTGILCRRMLSLRALRGLVPGSVIPLPQNALDDARIETVTGQLVARGKLGEADGFHAIRLGPGMGARLDIPETGRIRTATESLTEVGGQDPFRDSEAAKQGSVRAAG
ncbi:FliM/FliN family flagellar motor C-terminal domain-containing protein [Paracoccus sp. CPCC 101403]|uniref:FliM/FliN family flagellar motor C-terminal domain-containing protein n=2 Tax=Paracoccus broussonetiae TaxID=3075834 RepID=A0ABU3EJT4_9RHOB|nr:FliM/FliN family flagellar motor C-terminal domain-containing protein [Paracoccus sp. CPCC 101403]